VPVLATVFSADFNKSFQSIQYSFLLPSSSLPPFLFFFFFFFSFFFGGTGFLTQGLVLARQVPHPHPFSALVTFQIGSHVFAWASLELRSS
jgi:hypothetical protein